MLHHGQTCKPPLEGREIRNQCGHRPFLFSVSNHQAAARTPRVRVGKGGLRCRSAFEKGGLNASSRHVTQVPMRRHFRRTAVMECEAETHPYSALMLAARTTLPHFSVSSAMTFPKSPSEPANTSHPRELAEGWEVRQHLRTRSGGYGERAQPASLDILNR